MSNHKVSNYKVLDHKVQLLSCQSLCKDCAFYVSVECTHPEELGVNCATVIFCSSFTPTVEVESPCVTFGNDDL